MVSLLVFIFKADDIVARALTRRTSRKERQDTMREEESEGGSPCVGEGWDQQTKEGGTCTRAESLVTRVQMQVGEDLVVRDEGILLLMALLSSVIS